MLREGAIAAVLPLLAGILCSAGCVEIAGGAVEARWDLRDGNGVRVGCAATPVAALRFALRPMSGGTDPCADDPNCRFACDLGGGATGFTIPQADYAMTLQPLDQDGQPLGPSRGVVAPAPVNRTVREGQVTDLNVNLIIVEW